MKNIIKGFLAGLFIAGIACAAYLLIVCMGCTPRAEILPNCVNVFHPLCALFLGSISLSIFCGVLLAELRNYR